MIKDMRILWLCNIVLPMLRNEFGFKNDPFGSWFSNMLNMLREVYSDCEFGLCCPIIDARRMKDGVVDNICYYSFQFQDNGVLEECMVNRFYEIIDQFDADIIHIWGTEYPHALAMLRACEKKHIESKVILDIQGLVSKCSEVMGIGCDDGVYEKYRDKFIEKSINEIEILKRVKNAVGRTEWTEACYKQLNPEGRYYNCNRIEQDVFYENSGSWNYEKCHKHSIFISQGAYPLKGLHMVIKSIPLIMQKYPDVKVVCAGPNPLALDNEYSSYLNSLIRKYDIKNVISFVGTLNGFEMCNQYKSANVFLSASNMEASANSVCEAMMIGCPVVSSYVGGISSLLSHQEEGFLYPVNEYYMIAYYIERIFSEIENTRCMSEKATNRALRWVDKETNCRMMHDIYLDVYNRHKN